MIVEEVHKSKICKVGWPTENPEKSRYLSQTLPPEKSIFFNFP